MPRIDLFRAAQGGTDHPAGDRICGEGDPGSCMYVVQEGEVEIRRGDRVVEVLGPGEVFGELALIDRAPRSATAVARTACRIYPIDERRFEFLVQQTPGFALQVMRAVVERLRRNERESRGGG